MDLKELDLLGPNPEDHWYYVSKGRALRHLLAGASVAEVLDVGAGSGVFARQFLDAGLCRRAVCVDPNYAEDRLDHHHGKEIEFRRSIEAVTQGLILMIDVLEHVPDDDALLQTYTDGAPAGTLVLISVPAFRFLWSGHDEFLGHERRYTLRQVETLVRRAGLEVVTGRYFFATLFPLVAMLRWYDHLRIAGGKHEPKSAMTRQARIVNTGLTWIHTVEQRSVFRINRLAGLSAFCLARRLS